jgi:hypothetical protein
MRRRLTLLLSDDELLDLWHVRIDRDATGALGFLERHLKKPTRQALEGG